MRLDLRRVRRALIVAPHPDDEIIGAAALIRTLRRQGSQVRVIVVSDGAASHPGSPRWPTAKLVSERRRESLRALRRLAVRSADVAFLGLPDGALATTEDRCRRALRRALARRPGAELLVGPGASDAHPDHRSVAAVLQQLRGGTRRLSYQVWPARAHGGSRSVQVVIAGGAAAKRSLIRMHRTQSGAIRDDPAGFAIARHEMAAFAHPVECFVEERR